MNAVLRISAIALFGAMAATTAQADTGTYTTGTNTVAAPQVAQQAASQTAGQISSRIGQAVSGAASGAGAGSGGGFGGTGGGTSPGGGPGGGPGQQGSSVDGGITGRSAGSEEKKIGLWFNVGVARASDTHAFETFHGSINTAVGGIDYKVLDNAVAGIAVGYEMARITTTFNNGTMAANNVGIAPYFGYAFNDNFSVDATVGYAFVNYAVTRNGGQIKGDTGGGRMFGAANFTARTWVDRWQLSTGLGYMYLQETQDAYNERGAAGNTVSMVKIRLGQLRSVNKVGYYEPTSWGSVMPYVMARPEYDANKTPASVLDSASQTKSVDGRFGTTFGLGLNMAVGDDSTINLEGTTSQFRRYLGMDGVSGTVRLRF